MGIFSASNLHDETWLIFFFMKLLGLYPAGCCTTPGTGYVYVVLLLLIYNATFAGVMEYMMNVFAELTKALAIVKLRRTRYRLNTILLHLIVISTSYHSTKIKKVCEEIDNVDKGFKYLNIRIDHTSSMKKDVVRTLNIILIVLLLNLLDYYSLWNYQRDYMYTVMWIIDRVPDFVNSILICSHASLATQIALRFAAINRALERIVQERNYLAIYKPINNNSAFRWKLLKLLNMKLRKSISLINGAYGFQFALLAFVYLIFTCLHFNIVYLNSYTEYNPADVIVSTFWGIFDVGRLLYIISSYRMLLKQYT